MSHPSKFKNALGFEKKENENNNEIKDNIKEENKEVKEIDIDNKDEVKK